MSLITPRWWEYSQIPWVHIRNCFPVSQKATLWWNPPITLLMRVFTTHVSKSKSKTAYTIYFKKRFKVHASALSRPIIIDNCAYLFMALIRFATTTYQ